MALISVVSRLVRVMVLLPIAIGFGTPALAQDAKPFSKEQLDQMTAQVALYPDSLLSQLFMATTYPDEFAKAYAWSKAHPDSKGDEAVRMVESEGWDPSVASMVAFPEVLITLGEKPDWVKNMGDAFLAQPEDVMDSVQRLRALAQKNGNLKSNEQVKVSTEPAPPPAQAPTTTVVQQAAPPPQVIVIEPAQPSVVYVPAYNPAVVYGAWPYPAYPPYYYPTPPGYWFSRTIATGIAWGVGIGVANAMWGGFNWGRGDVNINVNRYNNINVNNRITNNNWTHNSYNRNGVPYRNGPARDQYGHNIPAKYNNDRLYGGRGEGPQPTQPGQRDAERQRAEQTLSGRVGEQNMNRQALNNVDRSTLQNRGAGGQNSAGQRDFNSLNPNAARGNYDNAFRGANNAQQTREQMDRGAASRTSMQQREARPQQAREQRPQQARPQQARPQQARPQENRGGGGAARGGGGGGGRRR